MPKKNREENRNFHAEKFRHEKGLNRCKDFVFFLLNKSWMHFNNKDAIATAIRARVTPKACHSNVIVNRKVLLMDFQ